jgi:hypothetical protein
VVVVRIRIRLAIAGAALIVGACSAPGVPSASPTPHAAATATAPHTSPDPSTAILDSGPIPSPSVGPDPSALPTTSASATSTTPRPTATRPPATPTPTPALKPSVALLFNDSLDPDALWIVTGGTVTGDLALVTRDLDRADCSVTHETTPDDPDVAPSSTSLQPVARQTVALTDGVSTFRAACPSATGTLRATVVVRALDGKAERCLDWSFERKALSAPTYEALATGVVGTWQGCVLTPWIAPYFVTMTLRADETYSAISTEVLDGQDMIAMYYGMDEDAPQKRYHLADMLDDGLGVGQIDIVFDVGSVNRGDLRNVRLMGDRLEFEFFHRGQYGPLVFQLLRVP